MGTRGTALFTDDNGMWARAETRWDGHTLPAILRLAAAPYAKMARAESDMATALAKGEEAFLEGRWHTLIEAMLRMDPHEPEAHGVGADGPDQALGHRRALAIQSAHAGLSHMKSFFPFGEFDACSMARDLCSPSDRWTVDEAGTGAPPKSARRDLDFTVESSGARVLIETALWEGKEGAAKIAEEFDRALNGPLAPLRAYKVVSEPVSRPKKDGPVAKLRIERDMEQAFVALAWRRAMAHPEIGAGLRLRGNRPKGANPRHALLAEAGLAPHPIDDAGHGFVDRVFLGLPISAQLAADGSSHLRSQAAGDVPWMFKHASPEAPPEIEELTRHGDPDFGAIEPALALSAGFSLACHWADDEVIGEGGFKALRAALGDDQFCQALSDSMALGLADAASPSIQKALADASKSALAKSVPSPKQRAPKASRI